MLPHPMSWWHWLVLGLILVLLEMAASGGFYVIFFGIAAIAISALHLFDVAGPIWFQLLLFSALSIGALLLFRGPLLRLMQPESPADRDSPVGEIAVPLEDISPGAVGRAELRGAVWSARNGSAATVARGERCRVVKVDRLMIVLESEGVRG
jgi:membrane protein implicated in regulation of membrane protease activity